jgi:DNA polymerase-1
MARLLVLDGNSLAYRAFFALPTDLATAAGQVTNAVLGFTQMLIFVVKEQRPDGVIVAFDRPEPTFRHGMVDDYKAGREAAPDILKQQMGLVRQVLESLKVPTLEVAGFEADDIIATLATQARDRGDEVIIVTGDRDSYQLVEDPYIRVMYNKRGVSDYALYDEAGIKERTGVTPELYPQYAALRGDPSDNLPGVPGVGEKTAAKLINEYGGIDGIYENLEKLTPKLRENLAAAEDAVRANAEVIPLIRDVELPELDPDAVQWGGWDEQEVRDLFAFLEFRGPIERLIEAFGSDGRGGAAAATPSPVSVSQETIDVTVTIAPDAKAVVALAKELAGGVAVVASWEGRPGRSPLAGLALCAPDATDAATFVPAALLGDATVVKALCELFGAPGAVTAADAKTLLRSLLPLGIDLKGLGLDVEIAAYLIDPAQSNYDLNELVLRYLGIALDAEAAASSQGQLLLDNAAPSVADLTGKRAVAMARLITPLTGALEARGLTKLYEEIERPLVRVLARMEVAGIAVDREWLHDLNTALTKECGELEAEIHELAGGAFKVNSTPQLREVLFDKLGLNPSKKTKTGFSTDAQSLEKLIDQHPIVGKLLRWREVEKLRNTYGEALAHEIAEDGRIHASFNQTVARTGRLSSESPNLHNIPVRSEEGRQFRRAFIPAQGHRLLVADYNQIELRVIAHLSDDPGLTAAFRNGDDIHATTAARIYGVDPADVTVAQRSKAKMVSYGLAYGMESYGLAQRLGIPVDEASVILNAYFVAFPAVKAYMDNSVKEARDRGYTETLFGRRRPIPELSSPNFRIRQAGERQAMNAGIQGLAADIFKVALVELDRRLEAEGLATRIVLQVHDEIILEVPKNEEKAAEAATLEAMRGAAQLHVPLEVNLGWGDTWADAK